MCNISYLSDGQDHIHDSERDHETTIKRLCKRSRPLSGLPYLVSSDRYHLNEYFLRLSSPGWIFRVSLLHAPGKREREALGTSLSLFLQPERNGDASDQKRICPIIFFFTWYKLSWRAIFAWEYNQSSPTLRWFLTIALRIVYSAYKPRTQGNERARIPRTRYCFSINGPGKEVRCPLALERAQCRTFCIAWFWCTKYPL